MSIIPSDFDWRVYLKFNPDLGRNGIKTHEHALKHWIKFGWKENRKYEYVFKPMVSVIVPVYNVEKYILECIISLINQTYKNIEIIVVNDKSTDKTEIIVNNLKKKYPNKIKLINNTQNKGTYISLNIGINNSRGELITKLDGDDIFMQNKIEKQVNIFKYNTELLVCYSLYTRIHYNSKETLYKGWGECTILFKRSIIKDIGYFDSVRFSADSEFCRRIEKKYDKSKLYTISEILYKALYRPNSLTNSGIANQNTIKGLDLRQEYVDNYTKWHNSAEKLYMDFPLVKRKFKVPLLR